MLSKADRQRARFAPNDPVEFGYLEYRLKGTIVRLNPKRAVVQVDDEQFSVPYDRLIPTSGKTAEREEKIEKVLQTALELLAQHGLNDWQFKFDHSTRRAGACYYHDKQITLAFDLAHSGTEETIRDTILHEIAHALVGENHNHDAVWKTKAREIGCSGERTHSLEFAPPRWTVTCENRCWTHTAQQRNSKLICRTCGSRLVYTPYSAPA
ncbi:SprT-like domain-containing protein [Pontiellaceae bacterium B12227]|nr:SprT-like domain-containing protein [Pontiellaceae bacterium B12227]